MSSLSNDGSRVYLLRWSMDEGLELDAEDELLIIQSSSNTLDSTIEVLAVMVKILMLFREELYEALEMNSLSKTNPSSTSVLPIMKCKAGLPSLLCKDTEHDRHNHHLRVAVIRHEVMNKTS